MTAQKSRQTPASAKSAKNDGVEVTTDTGTRKTAKSDGAEATADTGTHKHGPSVQIFGPGVI